MDSRSSPQPTSTGRDRQRGDQPHVEGDDLRGADDRIGGERRGRRSAAAGAADQPKRRAPGLATAQMIDRRAPTTSDGVALARGAIGPHYPFFLRALTGNFRRLPTAVVLRRGATCHLGCSLQPVLSLHVTILGCLLQHVRIPARNIDPLLERANTTSNDSLNIEEDRRTIIYNNMNMRKHLCHVHVFSQF